MKPMKHILHTKALMGLMILLAGAVVVACKKDPTVENNPPVRELSAATFTLSAVETRGTKHASFDWTVSKDGVTDSVSEELDEMTVTPKNNIVFTVMPDGNAADFPGFNVRSSNVNAVRVENVSRSEFALKYVGSGDAVIKVWNGPENSNLEFKNEFKVKARETIPLEGFLIRVDDKEMLVKFANLYDWDELKKQRICDFPYHFDKPDEFGRPDEHLPYYERLAQYSPEELYVKKITWVHVVPENTTWRFLYDSHIGTNEYMEVFFPDELCTPDPKYGKVWKEENILYIENGTDVSFFNGRYFYFGTPLSGALYRIVDMCEGFSLTDYLAGEATIWARTSGARSIRLYGTLLPES